MKSKNRDVCLLNTVPVLTEIKLHHRIDKDFLKLELEQQKAISRSASLLDSRGSRMGLDYFVQYFQAIIHSRFSWDLFGDSWIISFWLIMWSMSFALQPGLQWSYPKQSGWNRQLPHHNKTYQTWRDPCRLYMQCTICFYQNKWISPMDIHCNGTFQELMYL